MIKIEVRPADEMFTNLLGSITAIGSRTMPATRRALGIAADEIIANEWRSYALGGPIEGSPHRLKNPKGGYAAGIKVKKIGPFHYQIVNDTEVAKWLEYGTSELDMKKTHPYGWKSRVANKGTKKNPRWVPYLIIPFRWGTPKGGDESAGHFRNIIPAAIYRQLLARMKAGRFIRTRIMRGSSQVESNVWGEDLHRNRYETENGDEGWGSRLEGIGGNIEGLVAMPSESGNERKRSSYFTFRVISAESPANSWIRPAQPAMHITRWVVKNTQERVASLIRFGMQQDLGVFARGAE